MGETADRPVVVGDVFRESWGYDQTNVNWFEVVRVSSTGSTVWIREIGSRLVDEDRNVTHVVPVRGAFLADSRSYRYGSGEGNGPVRKKVRWIDGLPALSMTSYSAAYLWDGRPAYETASGWGH